MKKYIKRMLVAALIIQIGTGMAACRTKTLTPDDVTVTPGVSAAPTQGEAGDGVTKTPEATTAPSGAAATPEIKNPDNEQSADEMTPVPTETIKEDPTDSNYKVSVSECEKTLSKITGSGYSFTVISKELKVDEDVYCIFSVSDEKTILTPYMAVNRNTGDVVYYGDGVIYDFTAFPPDNTEINNTEVNSGSDAAAQKEIYAYLEGMSKEKLGLEKQLEEYELSMDDWTSVVNGSECYCINVFEKSGSNSVLTAVYYVSVDKATVYRLDEDGIFVKISD